MERVLSRDVKAHVGKRVSLNGWLHKKRLLGGLNFINLRDRSGLVQIVLNKDEEMEKLRGMQTGTVLSVTGMVVEEPRAPGGAELHDAVVIVDVAVTDESPIEIDKPLSHKPENLDTLFDNRVIGLRNLAEQAIFKIQAEVEESIRAYLKKQDFTQFNSPKLLPGATEGGAEVFKLDYFGKEATLAQSAQFYKQIMVGVFERVFEINPTYRAEPSATTRHMTEFITVDIEIGFIAFPDLLDLLSNLLNSVVNDVWEKAENQLKMWEAKKPLLPAKIPALTMAEIHEKYTKATGTSTVNELDLRPDEERWICKYATKELGSEAVFVTDWPREDAKFYHKFKDDEPKVAERADLLFRGVEIATGSMREHRYDVLVKQLKEIAGGKPEDPGFKYFLQAFRYGMPPHGGWGWGLERTVEKLIGLNNVKEATLFPRDINRLVP
ncbi:aspartate--tRNA(Asn) ligase [Candidatus Saccharibacteria bacterium CG10_big_fil_rev_8_21_14_0_10_47_8]|nr:MAG: aspartate--tRNA(Asn) ligase [Candidatus Saccharibacteria bacterium CG10_big_fil_rev_8_21_14_0_10_47_8]